MVSHKRDKRCQTFDEEPWKALIPPFRQWNSAKQVFNLHSVTIQHNFCTFVAVLHIFISQNLFPTNRDGLSHAWLFKTSGVNVINVHDYNAELQLSVLICGAVPFVWDSIFCQAWDPPAVLLKSTRLSFKPFSVSSINIFWIALNTHSPPNLEACKMHKVSGFVYNHPEMHASPRILHLITRCPYVS